MTVEMTGGEIEVVKLPERVDAATSLDVERLVGATIRPGARVILDGHAVTYMSAAGVRTLATVLHRAQAVQARIAFCRFEGAAADCLAVSGFFDLFDVAHAIEEAAERLRPRGGAG